MRRVFDYFESLIEPFPEDEAAQPPNRLSAFVLYFIRPHWRVFAAVSALACAAGAIEIWLFAFLGHLVDALVEHDPATLLEAYGPMLALAAVAAVCLPIVSALFNLTMFQGIYGNFPARLRWHFHRYLLRQSAAFYQDEFAGRISTKLMQTALSVRDVATKLTDVFVYVLTYVTGIFVVVAQLDWRLALPFGVWLIAYAAGMRYFVPRFARIAEAQSDARSNMTGRVTDAYTNITTVKLFSHAARESAFAREGMVEFRKPVDEQMRLSTVYEVAFSLLHTTLLIASGALALWLWLRGDVGAGAVAVSIGLVLRIEGMSHWFGWEINHLFENIGTTLDGMQMLSKPLNVTNAADATPLALSAGLIEFDAVDFAYPGQTGVFERFDLRIAGGERIGLVGTSGAGKSTLVNLLLRLFDVDAGAIRIDGQRIDRVSQRSLRAAIGVVTQDTSLLHRSVADNIGYGKPDASAAAIAAAAHQAEAVDFIDTLQDAKGRTGYQAHVGERGVKLSGGQRQRIAIARVLLKDAPILVLDEATSALDSEVEAAISDSLDALMRGKTVIAIAHRLSTIARMDRLVVIDNGRIVETGTHEELVARGGHYAALWHRQSGGFIGG
ncbi:MAG: ABC transporter ATP-binding protein [Pseudomonadota bacterium]